MIIVVRLSPVAKNVPQRNRAGFKFSHEPKAADVSTEQLRIIQDDPYLKICNFPSVAWFEALGIERTQKNEDAYKDQDGGYIQIKSMPKSAILAEEIESAVKVSPKVEKTPPEPTVGQGGTIGTEPEKPKELSASSSADELIAVLVKRGKVEGKDFSKGSKPEALFALLKTL